MGTLFAFFAVFTFVPGSTTILSKVKKLVKNRITYLVYLTQDFLDAAWKKLLFLEFLRIWRDPNSNLAYGHFSDQEEFGDALKSKKMLKVHLFLSVLINVDPRWSPEIIGSPRCDESHVWWASLACRA